MSRHASANRIYRLIWSQVRSAWVPVAETARARGKSGRAKSVSPYGVVAGVSFALAPLAHASGAPPPCAAPTCGVSTVSASSRPTGGHVVSGRGSISQTGDTTTIQQSSQNVFLDWLSFNVGSEESVNFVQPSANAIAVNEISSLNGSQILGHLNANGEVWLLNPNGIVFGQGAQVNVGGLVASALNEMTLSGNTANFSGSGAGTIVNEGTINAATGGSVALLGNHVSNGGTITAKMGTVALGAGSAVTLTFSGNSLVKMQVDESTLNTLAENGGVIQADGGTVIVSAGAKNALLASVVNNTGVIEARTVQSHDGTIELLGGMTAGTVNVGGTLDASAPEGGNGGFIETNAARVEVANDAKVTTAAAHGLFGSWLIDPPDFTVAPTGGDETGAALSGALNSSNVTILSSNGTSPVTGGGSGGNINIDDTVSWSANTLTLNASNNININSPLKGSGTASLALFYGQGAGNGVINGVTASYNVNAPVSLAAGPNFSTQLGTAGTLINYTVVDSLSDLQNINNSLAGNYALGASLDATGVTNWVPLGTDGAGHVTNSGSGFSGIFDGLGNTISNLAINLSSTNYLNYVGLFGYSSGTIRNIGMVNGSMSGYGYVGGLLGVNNKGGTVSNSYATGSVSLSGSPSEVYPGPSEVGGLVAINDYGGTISNSYATGSVTGFGPKSVGALVGPVGGLVGFNQGTITNSYATGNVSGGSGGLVGSNLGTVNNSYATGNVSGDLDVGGLAGDNGGTITNSYATGSVSGSNYVGGLVGHASFGSITHSHATGSVEGSNYVGGLVGYNYIGDVQNSYAKGNVRGSQNVGGLVGYNNGYGYDLPYTGGYIANSYAAGNVSGAYGVGGLLGASNRGFVTNSYATGGVSGGASSSIIGGLVGSNTYLGTISNSYATGRVSGGASSTMIGGLVGSNSNYGYIETSYATGGVSGGAGSSAMGGLVGANSNTSKVINSFWDTTTSRQSSSAGGTGMTTAQMQTQANFTSARSANGNVNPGWDFTTTWVMYSGQTFPLLQSFMTPLTVTANNATTTYNGSAYSGSNGVTYSVTPNANLLGTLSYSGTSQGAVNVGSYTITPGGLYSNQEGYIISYATGTLSITQLASVAWVGGASGNWSQASNWAGGAIPDLSNVDAVTIRKGTTVTYDAGVAGTTILTSLTDLGQLVMAAGDLTTTGNLSTAGYQQTGGLLDVGGTLTINATAGSVIVGNIDAGALSIVSPKGAISQLAGSSVDVSGASTLAAGTGTTAYNITLTQPTDSFGGEVSAQGLNISLLDTSSNGLTLGNTTATGTLTATSRGGAIAQAASTAVQVTGATSLTANDGGMKYDITLALAGNSFGGEVSANGLNIDLEDGSANGLTLGNITATGTLTLTSLAGALTQAPATTLNVTGATSLTADNGVSGAEDVKYDITLANTTNHFGGAVSSDGLDIDLWDKTGALTLGNTTATGTFSATSSGGAITQLVSTALDVTGATSLTASNGGTLNYNISLGQAANNFGGTVTADGSAITLDDAAALTVNLDSSGASTLTSAGAMTVTGTVGTALKTTTTGADSATTFGATTVGTNLTVTSTGAVSETSANVLEVDGQGTTTVANPHVTVNGVKGAEIPAP